MGRHIFLDSSPLGALSQPVQNAEVIAINRWARACAAANHTIYIPEVIDYELRRELLRAGKSAGLARLDGLKTVFTYLPLTTAAMLHAAELWANSRRAGIVTADPKRLDIDVILAAQALTSGAPLNDIIIATINVRHLSKLAPADIWSNITT